MWKQKLYYGYNFDIYYHQDSRSNRKENGWSVSLTPEIGWRLNERMYMGVRLGGSYQDSYDKVGIWLEAHLYTGMQYPRVTAGKVKGTDYDGLRHTIVYGAQVSPVITYQFNKKSTLQLFFSIISFGYSGTTFCYTDPDTGKRYNEHTNDIIVFSGRLRNLLSNQFMPGLYGVKFGVMKSF